MAIIALVVWCVRVMSQRLIEGSVALAESMSQTGWMSHIAILMVFLVITTFLLTTIALVSKDRSIQVMLPWVASLLIAIKLIIKG